MILAHMPIPRDNGIYKYRYNQRLEKGHTPLLIDYTQG